MAYCGPRGLALDTFLSWPASSQDAALQWMARESRRCSNCHTHAEDWNPDEGGSRNFQHWHPQVCVGCQRKQAAEAALAADNDKTRGLGLVAADGPAHLCEVCRPD